MNVQAILYVRVYNNGSILITVVMTVPLAMMVKVVYTVMSYQLFPIISHLTVAGLGNRIALSSNYLSANSRSRWYL